MATTSVVHERAVVSAALEAAWLRHRGPDDTVREWRFAGEFLPVIDGFADEPEVSLYPSYGYVKDGKVVGWSLTHPAKSQEYVECWRWQLGVGWDDLDQATIEKIEDMGGCFDDHDVSFEVEGSHQERPRLPDEVVEALVLARAGDQ